ncbi:hypothetical protein CO2235_190101 [Cupriavidus oxalaticus]|uniref:Uncharacterized protein n=1 Tax=Cupriavidus oxalaticus TaxID=96344 RepID=A0A375G6D3_9BURK|nr:hypothetical protein CO2235_190101 [Cupriavidus oxalaticus]
MSQEKLKYPRGFASLAHGHR